MDTARRVPTTVINVSISVGDGIPTSLNVTNISIYNSATVFT